MRKLRTLFISDLHMGTRGCQADLLLEFLRQHDADCIYLVGDIVDGWRLKRGWYWPQAHNEVVQLLLARKEQGARLVYIPGNHDEFMRSFLGMDFGGIEVRDTAIHETATGKRLLVIHGDQFDVVVRTAKWLALLGDWAYEAALAANTHLNSVRRKLGFPYWSLSAWAKLKVKNAVNFIGDFEAALVRDAEDRAVDGVVCGHIHHAMVREMSGITYMNCGDWVESCTALVEHPDGRFELVRWAEPQPASRPRLLTLPAAA